MAGEVREKNVKYKTLQQLNSLQDPGRRYALKDCIGSGVCGDVYEAIDQQAGKRVAIKIQNITPETQSLILEEYRVLRDFSDHPNLPDFYGVYRKRSNTESEYDQVWFVMELCEGGPVTDLVRGLIASERQMREEHIGYILKEVIKALMHMHENNVIHRDIQGNNIVLTKEGEVRLVDFGLSRILPEDFGKRRTCIGSPCWMAPEVINSKGEDGGYGRQADVWAIGITAIELAEGKPPFHGMHPTRVLFQIVRNPPPTLYRPDNWSEKFNDFITECLEKNPENRPFMEEIIEHPFLTDLPENDYLLSQEIKVLAADVSEKGKVSRKAEAIVRKGYLKTHQNEPPEPMFTEDLAAKESLTEETILDELRERLRQGYYHTFVGDVLLILNPNEEHNIYGTHYHTKYEFKSRSDNAPHIYSVADSAYQDVLHNDEPQHILFAGESNSGKTTNMLHVVEHLMYLGKSLQSIGGRVKRAIEVIHTFVNAATPLNSNSTRCLLQTQTTYGSSGRASGAIFFLYLLEKWRVSTADRNQSNFHVFYYFYDGLEASGQLERYFLPSGRRLKYLRVGETEIDHSRKQSFKLRDDVQENIARFERLKENLKMMEMEEHCKMIWKILAAILLLGDIKFIENNGEADIVSKDIVSKVAELLGVDQKKFRWSLLNYCLIKKGSAIRRKHTCVEAREARDVLANTIYQRLVDWVINLINYNFRTTRTLFGDKFSINILDLFGFECFSINRYEQLIVNIMNEQMQYYYNQRVFAWEMQEQREEEVPVQNLRFYDNREAIDELMGKNIGLLYIIDHASRQLQSDHYVIESLKQRTKNVYVKAASLCEFTVAHYTGRVLYDTKDITEKNRNFLPPEIIETLRLSSHETIKQLFTNQLTKSGNLTLAVEHNAPETKPSKLRRYNTASRGQFSQTRNMRTYAATFRSASLEILKNISVGCGSSGTHFVRCIRTDLKDKPRGFNRELVRQQIRALAVLDTVKARQHGYSHRILFEEFLRRYKFLAFDFDENVEMTKENCRLLLIRLKMEGWMIGKTKVFLKYYNEEYLARLYETQVKKVIKIQSIIRAYLSRKRMKKSKSQKTKKEVANETSTKKTVELTDDEAAITIQKAYKGHRVRKELQPVLKGEMDQTTKNFIKLYISKWRSKSIYQVLVHYRAARYQDFVHFSQQVHLYNQAIKGVLEATSENVFLDQIEAGVKASSYLDERKPLQVRKLPFNLQQEFLYFDTKHLHDPATTSNERKESVSSSVISDDEHEPWDTPLRREKPSNNSTYFKDVEVQTTDSPHRSTRPSLDYVERSLINIPFSRDPNVPVRCPPEETLRNKLDNPDLFSSNDYNSFQSVKSTTYSNVNNTGSIRSRKKGPPPPVPISQVHPSTRSFNYNEVRNTNIHNTNDWELEDRANRNIVSSARINPIQELQMLSRKNEDEDEPPFNFQAMLRKTHHQRASMKRSHHTYSRVAPLSIDTNHFTNRREVSSDFSRRYEEVRAESPEWSPNEMVKISEKFANEEFWNVRETNAVKRVTSMSQCVTAELAPGIIVEGYVADL